MITNFRANSRCVSGIRGVTICTARSNAASPADVGDTGVAVTIESRGVRGACFPHFICQHSLLLVGQPIGNSANPAENADEYLVELFNSKDFLFSLCMLQFSLLQVEFEVPELDRLGPLLRTQLLVDSGGGSW